MARPTQSRPPLCPVDPKSGSPRGLGSVQRTVYRLDTARTALEVIGFTIRVAELTAFVGPNGSGATNA